MSVIPERRRRIDWGRVADQLRADPNRWVLLPEMTFVSPVFQRRLALRRSRALRGLPGVILTRRVGSVTVEDGRVLCNLYLKYLPEGNDHDREEEFESETVVAEEVPPHDS